MMTASWPDPATVRALDVVVIPTSREMKNPVRFETADALVAFEIVSPGTGRTDRVAKLTEYTDDSFPHYWLVELVTLDLATLTARR